MRYAWITNNLVDLRAQSDFHSERVSQLFFAELVRVGESKAGFVRVYQADGYTGWVDGRFLSCIDRTAYEEYGKRVNGFISAATARLFDDRKGRNVPPYFLFYGTKLYVKKRDSRFARILLPDGGRVFVKPRTITPIHRGKSPVTGSRIVAEAKRFLGVPYLWGGITVTGFDCSGLVRTVYSRFGFALPRDTKDQIMVGEKVERESIKSGDLVFFRRHVGLAIGNRRIIHASHGGGGVRINALVKGLPEYREDLDRDFLQARRVTP